MKSDRSAADTDYTKMTEDTGDSLSQEYYQANSINHILSKLDRMTLDFDERTVKFLGQLVMNDLPAAKKLEENHIGLTQKIDVLSTTAHSRSDSQQNNSMNFILSMLEGKLRDIETKDRVVVKGMASDHEDLVNISKKKINTLAGVIKLNNLDPFQIFELERYFELGDLGEIYPIKFSLYKKLGGPKRIATLNMMRVGEFKKLSLTNKTVLTAKPSLADAIKLPKQIFQVPLTNMEIETPVSLLHHATKTNYSDSQNINQKFKIKKMSMAGLQVGSKKRESNNRSKSIADDLFAATAELEVLEVHQFPTKLKLRFDTLSSYSIYFLKKFVKKKIINAYVHEIRKMGEDDDANWLRYKTINIVEREVNNAGVRKLVQEEMIQEQKNRNLKNISTLAGLTLAKFKPNEAIITDTDLLKTTTKIEPVHGLQPLQLVKANKYSIRRKKVEKR